MPNITRMLFKKFADSTTTMLLPSNMTVTKVVLEDNLDNGIL
jgi:hypothetical protein